MKTFHIVNCWCMRALRVMLPDFFPHVGNGPSGLENRDSNSKHIHNLGMAKKSHKNATNNIQFEVSTP